MDAKQDTLVSGTNIKTINGQTLLGEGNIEIQGGGSGISDAPSDNKLYGRKNANWSEIIIPSTDNFATKSEIADMLTKTEASEKYQPKGEYLTEVPSEYITETELSEKGYLTSIPEEYVTETELSGKGYATTAQLANKVDTSTYTEDKATFATKAELADKANTSDLSNYLTTTDAESTYAKKSEIPEEYTLPIATAEALGGIKVGAGLSISSAGVLSATGGGVADSVDWDNITSKPSWVDSTSKPTYTWSEISGKPSSFTPSSHTHGTDDVTTLTGYTEGTSTSTLTSSMTLNTALASLQNQIQTKANSSHTHTISQITNMGTLTFTGAATGSYDGSGNLTINIPESSSIDTSNFVTLNGTQTITGTKTFTQYTVFSAGAGTSSDKRLKRSIKPIENPFEILEGLTGYRYTLISNNAKSAGLIAQDVEKVLPEAVRTDDEGYKSVDTYPIVAVLVETIKELKKEIEELKSKL